MNNLFYVVFVLWLLESVIELVNSFISGLSSNKLVILMLMVFCIINRLIIIIKKMLIICLLVCKLVMLVFRLMVVKKVSINGLCRDILKLIF